MRVSQDVLVLGNSYLLRKLLGNKFSIIRQFPNGHPPGYATGSNNSIANELNLNSPIDGCTNKLNTHAKTLSTDFFLDQQMCPSCTIKLLISKWNETQSLPYFPILTGVFHINYKTINERKFLSLPFFDWFNWYDKNNL